MDIRSLRQFVAVSEERSLTLAARRLGISQPALSKSMTELEVEMGQPLLVRGSRGTALTDAGRVLYDRAREIIGMAERAETEVRAVGQDSGCDVLVGLGESPDTDDLSVAFGRVRERLPGSRLHLYADNMEGIRSKLEMGFVDIGITLGPVDESVFEGFPTGRETRYGVLVREDDPLASLETVGRDDLAGRPVIALRGAALHAGLAETFGDLVEGQTVATYNLINNASAMVRAGTGVAVTLEWLVDRTDSAGLRFRPLGPEARIGTSVIWLKGRKLSSTASALIGELRTASRCRRGAVRTAINYSESDSRPMSWLFGKKEEEPVENKMPEQSERQYNLFWMIRRSPFADYSDEEIQAAIDLKLKELRRTLNTNPVKMVKDKTERKVAKLESVSGDSEAIAAERDQAILHFNRNLIEDDDGTIPTDIAKIDAMVAREGWVDANGPVRVDGMPHCPKCGYVNRRTKRCVNCGAKLKL